MKKARLAVLLMIAIFVCPGAAFAAASGEQDPIDAEAMKILKAKRWRDCFQHRALEDEAFPLLKEYLALDQAHASDPRWILEKAPRSAEYMKATTAQQRAVFTFAFSSWLSANRAARFGLRGAVFAAGHSASPAEDFPKAYEKAVEDGTLFELVPDENYRLKKTWAQHWWREHSSLRKQDNFEDLVHDSILDATEMSYRAEKAGIGRESGETADSPSPDIDKHNKRYHAHHLKEQTANLAGK